MVHWRRVHYDPAKIYNSRGYDYFKKGDWDKAIKCYDSALKSQNNFPEALSNRGVARLQKGDINGAIMDCSQALRLAPNLIEALCNRGSALQQNGNVHEAIQDFTRAISQNNHFAEAYANRAGAYLKIQKYKKALEDCHQALRHNPSLVEPCETAYKIYCLQDNHKMSHVWYRKLLWKRLTKNVTEGKWLPAITNLLTFLRSLT